MSNSEQWRERLRAAVDRTGWKHSAVARDAGIAAGTLSRILNGTHKHPTLDSVIRVARVCKVSVGWILGESDLRVAPHERATLLDAAEILLRSEGWRVEYEYNDRGQTARMRLMRHR